MMFAKIEYVNSIDEIEINTLVKKMPKKICDYYIEKVNPYIYTEFEIMGAKGYKIKLPLTLPEAKENYKKNEILIKKTLDDIHKKGGDIEIVVPPEEIMFPNIIKISDGKAIFAFSLQLAISKILKILDKDIRNTEFLIIDGGNFITNLILDCIRDEINYLSVYTDRIENFEERAEEIYEDCGLNIQVFSNSKNALMREADIVINGGADLENYDYFFKKGAVYLDVNKNRPKLTRLRSKRTDMIFIDNIELKWDGNYLKTELFEGAEYINNSDFSDFLSRQYNEDIQKKLLAYFNDKKIAITGFFCGGKRLGEEVFLKAIK